MLSFLAPATPALLRFIGLAVLAALWTLEHLRLGVRAFRSGATAGLIALAVPGAGAVYAYRDGARASAVVYALLALGYLCVRCWP